MTDYAHLATKWILTHNALTPHLIPHHCHSHFLSFRIQSDNTISLKRRDSRKHEPEIRSFIQSSGVLDCSCTKLDFNFRVLYHGVSISSQRSESYPAHDVRPFPSPRNPSQNRHPVFSMSANMPELVARGGHTVIPTPQSYPWWPKAYVRNFCVFAPRDPLERQPDDLS